MREGDKDAYTERKLKIFIKIMNLTSFSKDPRAIYENVFNFTRKNKKVWIRNIPINKGLYFCYLCILKGGKTLYLYYNY